MSLCKYKNMFGAPNTGVHSYRIFNVAIVDLAMTVIGAYIISVLIKKPVLNTFLVVFIIGIIMHRLFCVRTTVDKLLFPKT